jgi:hypothetical protein
MLSAQCFDTSAGGLLIPEDIIRPMVDTSAAEVSKHWADTNPLGLIVHQLRYRNIGQIISSGINSSLAEISTFGRIISSGTNSPPAEVSKH